MTMMPSREAGSCPGARLAPSPFTACANRYRGTLPQLCNRKRFDDATLEVKRTSASFRSIHALMKRCITSLAHSNGLVRLSRASGEHTQRFEDLEQRFELMLPAGAGRPHPRAGNGSPM